MYGTGERVIHGTGESLDDIVKRTALRIHVEWREGLGYRVQHRNPFYLSRWLGKSTALATYLILVSDYLDPAPTILPASTGDGAVLAGASASASLFESAAPTSGASSLAVANSGGC
jgi:hypothetical protein